MAISTDYPHPVNVNGFQCKNCTEVDYAKKHIDPAHPKDGPFGINKSDDAIKFGGSISEHGVRATQIQPRSIVDIMV